MFSGIISENAGPGTTSKLSTACYSTIKQNNICPEKIQIPPTVPALFKTCLYVVPNRQAGLKYDILELT